MNITIEFHIVEVWHQVSSQTNSFVFSDQIFPEWVFSVQSRNSGNYHRIQDIRISLDSKFHLKQTILSFWTKFAQTGYSQNKLEKVNITIEFSIFELFQMPNFNLRRQLLFGQIYPKRVEKILFIVNNPRIPKFFTYHAISFH